MTLRRFHDKRAFGFRLNTNVVEKFLSNSDT